MLERHRDGTTTNLRTPLQSKASMKESCTVPAMTNWRATMLHPSRSPPSLPSGADRVQTLAHLQPLLAHCTAAAIHLQVFSNTLRYSVKPILLVNFIAFE